MATGGPPGAEDPGQAASTSGSNAGGNGNGSGKSGSGSSYEFTYRGSDGRLKATFEQAFKLKSGAAAVGGGAAPTAPWEMGYMANERNLAWNDDLKARLVKRVAAETAGLSDEELEERLAALLALMPALRARLAGMRPATLAALAADPDAVALRLLGLKRAFPGGDVGTLASRVPRLVLPGADAAALCVAADRLRALFPRLDVDRAVVENPSMLDVDGVEAAVAEARRILPGIDVQARMLADPQAILSFQRGRALIPYDPPGPEEPQGRGPKDDDEYAAYYG